MGWVLMTLSGLELHQVGFQHHAPAAHVELVRGQHAAHGVVEILRIGGRARDFD
jgi:hypothetical protein